MTPEMDMEQAHCGLAQSVRGDEASTRQWAIPDDLIVVVAVAG